MGRVTRWLAAGLLLAAVTPLLLGALILTLLPATPALSAACAPAAEATGGWIIPFAQAYTVTSEYGWRKHPVTGQWKLHTGIDLAATTKPGRVLAAGPGTITTAGGVMGGYGNAIIVDHGGGVTTLYGHLASIDPAATVGAAVAGGTLLGIEGATGTATGIHLHYEVRLDGVPTNPRDWMRATHGLEFDGTGGGGGGGGDPVRHYDIGPVLPATQYAADYLGTMFDITTIYGWRPEDPYPDHPNGWAADFMVYGDRARGDALAGYAQTHATELRVDYIIWYQRIWSVARADEGWRPMADRGGTTANHKDHVHITVVHDDSDIPGGSGGCAFLGGVLSRDNLAAGKGGDRADELAGWAYEARWDDLNPAPDVWDFTGLDAAISYAAAHGQRFRLRIPGADTAPAHIKTLGGGPVPFHDHDHHRDTTIARYWSDEVRDAWRDLMSQLAAHIAGNPAVGEIQIGGTGLITPETMLLMGDETTSDGTTNAQHLRAAGLTDPLRDQVWRDDLTMMTSVWGATPLTLWCHPWQTLDGRASLATTYELIEYAHTLNPGIVFGHTGTDQATIEGKTPIWQMYQYLLDRGYPIALQTRSLDGGYDGGHPLGDLNTILTWAADHGVLSLELPRGWQTHVDPDVLAAANAAMQAHARGAGLTPPDP